ncbi:hypothetical protein DESC_740113 [Desulfosarcina cetonica]|uniref:FHA domain-containing protein n=1 Tax=Desulfosarcina cetonica TaxID=90730 RepID=UPI0012ED8226|nr:FHA domain-containing protein [Desulfosarcina cetonica]VTR69374.1 hypothetical protein DESC_740113 [Desulfosarcina cetonica]
MIIYCEECGFKNIVDEKRIHGKDPQIPCEQCGDLLRFYGLKAKALKAIVEKPRPAPKKKKAKPRPPALILKYGNVVVLVNESRPRVEIGRQKGNDIQVVKNRVSRIHAFIELKDGEYYLTDQSSNGTYFFLVGGQGTTLKNETVKLTAKGVIGPGYKVDLDSSDAIHILFETLS